MRMAAACALVLLTLAVLVHGSYAITCYVCRSKTEPACNDPFYRNSTGVHTLSCPGNACIKAKGTAKGGKQILTVICAHFIHIGYARLLCSSRDSTQHIFIGAVCLCVCLPARKSHILHITVRHEIA